MKSCTLNFRSSFIFKGLCVAFLAGGILFPDQAIACREAPPIQAAATLAVEGIHLRMSGAEVLQQLGAPQNALQRNLRCGTEVYLIYPQLLIKIQVPPGLSESNELESAAQGFISEFSTSDPNFSTQEGISIGASRSAVIDTYGMQAERSIQGDTLLDYRQADYRIMFLIRNDRVAEIQYSY